MPRWGRTIRQGQVSPTQEPSHSEGDFQPERRSLILGSMAALSAALMGAPRPSQAATVILEDSETRRMDVFERNAPCVVFIDTFTEKQDVFSPNVMEVPIGSGSGFVWDKEGHIGKFGIVLQADVYMMYSQYALKTAHSSFYPLRRKLQIIT
jgi:hypothetical protein